MFYGNMFIVISIRSYYGYIIIFFIYINLFDRNGVIDSYAYYKPWLCVILRIL